MTPAEQFVLFSPVASALQVAKRFLGEGEGGAESFSSNTISISSLSAMLTHFFGLRRWIHWQWFPNMDCGLGLANPHIEQQTGLPFDIVACRQFVFSSWVALEMGEPSNWMPVISLQDPKKSTPNKEMQPYVVARGVECSECEWEMPPLERETFSEVRLQRSFWCFSK